MDMDTENELKEEEDPELKKVLEHVGGGCPIPIELGYRSMGFNAFHKRRKLCVVGKKLVSDNFASTADYNLVTCNKKLQTKSVSRYSILLILNCLTSDVHLHFCSYLEIQVASRWYVYNDIYIKNYWKV